VGPSSGAIPARKIPTAITTSRTPTPVVTDSPATIAISDATLSEVSKLADQRLYYSSNSPAYVRSHTALLSLIQALAYGVYALDESAYADRIKAFRLK